MKPKTTMRRALEDPNLFGKVLAGDSWSAWRVVLIAAMGETLTAKERELWRTLTGRDREPGQRVEELWAVVGRRGGKTRAMSVLAAYLAALVDWSDCLVRGERGVLTYMGQHTKQAGTAFTYTAALFEDIPLLRSLLINQTANVLSLADGIDLEIRAASFRGIRGVTAIGVIAEEIAFWRDSDSANPDAEILNALRPALATTGGPLIAISSPHARRGELYANYRKHHGPDGDPLILVVHGASRTFNPSLPERVVTRALERDPVAARTEYLAEFRSDIEAFLTREAVEAVIPEGVRERAPIADVTYRGFVDPSGGSSDAMTLAIAHDEDGAGVLDAVRARVPPFSPEAVVEGFAELLKTYRISEVVGDRYAGEWPREAFRRHGIEYLTAEKTRSELYRDMLPKVNSTGIELLDVPKLLVQFVSLERRTARGGRETIDHAPGAHDDIANAVAGAIDLVTGAKPKPFEWYVGKDPVYEGEPVTGDLSVMPWQRF